ncbi:MAG: biopolymer transporter ExbD [Verrucomicrobia bacterium]|nr:biopolymer transporter ExbD [Verrucomicrobiota bacterium]MDA1086141.1 biopolymer transporter ExbD [Verrucomicrobiota bacterium]
MNFQDVDDDDSMKVNLDPMIDCVFLLIIFFLATTSFIKIEQDLTIDLPKQSREIKVKKPPVRPIVVNVNYQPGGKTTYHVENEQMSLAALTVNLSRARVRNKDQAVVIRGDRRVKWEHVAAVMSCSAQAGISKVSATVEIDEKG